MNERNEQVLDHFMDCMDERYAQASADERGLARRMNESRCVFLADESDASRVEGGYVRAWLAPSAADGLEMGCYVADYLDPEEQYAAVITFDSDADDEGVRFRPTCAEGCEHERCPVEMALYLSLKTPPQAKRTESVSDDAPDDAPDDLPDYDGIPFGNEAEEPKAPAESEDDEDAKHLAWLVDEARRYHRMTEGEETLRLVTNPSVRSLTAVVVCEDRERGLDFSKRVLWNALKMSHKIFRCKENLQTDFSEQSLGDKTTNHYYKSGRFYVTRKMPDGSLLTYFDQHMRPHMLHVMDSVDFFLDLTDAYMGTSLWSQSQKYMLREELAGYVEDRYMVVLATPDEYERLMATDPRLAYTLGRHVIRLASPDDDEIFRRFRSKVGNLWSGAGPEFEARFRGYLRAERATLPLKNDQLVEYLAQRCVAAGKLSVPEARRGADTVDEVFADVVGLKKVQDEVRELVDYASLRKHCKDSDFDLGVPGMHMLFEGPPGTGKTTVAQKMAHALFAAGVIEQDKLVQVSAKDLVGQYVGHTAPKTAEVIERAKGGVLFVDEAYALIVGSKSKASNTNDFGKEAIAALVGAMDRYRDRLVVIFAGYEAEMEEFVRVNPGMRSRIAHTLHFEDYSRDELLRIFDTFGKDAKGESRVVLTSEARVLLGDLFDTFTNFPDFGNGRFAREVYDAALRNYAVRCGGRPDEGDAGVLTLTAEDIPSEEQMMDSSEGCDAPAGKDPFAQVVGLDEVTEAIRQLGREAAFRKKHRGTLKLPRQSLCMVYRGNPGTGKTTVANITARELHANGVLPSDHVKRVRVSEIVGGWDNAGERMRDTIHEALGGVLLIDEAYGLMQGRGADEAITALVEEMEEQKGRISIILSGYTEQMDRLVNANPGLASRIGYTFDFPDYDAEGLEKIFALKVGQAGFTLSDEAREKARELFRYFQSVENFGNGRFVERVVAGIVRKCASRLADAPASSEVIVVADDVPGIDEMCEEVGQRIVGGPGGVGDEELGRVARHEAGHAVVALALMGETGVKKVTIEAEGGGSLGYVVPEKSSKCLHSASDYRKQMAVCLAGMAAEDLYEGESGDGVSSDLDQVTGLARRYVTRFGMSGAGLVAFGENVAVEALPRDVRDEMKAVLDEAYVLARDTIVENESRHKALTEALLKRRTMTSEEIIEVWQGATS